MRPVTPNYRAAYYEHDDLEEFFKDSSYEFIEANRWVRHNLYHVDTLVDPYDNDVWEFSPGDVVVYDGSSDEYLFLDRTEYERRFREL